VIQGIVDLGMTNKCQAILSGYMGSAEICEAVQDTVKEFKAQHPNIIYLCDPVMGNNRCFVKPEVVDFFRTSLIADIITPNQFEAEILTEITISNITTLKQTASYMHNLGVKIVVITGLKLAETSNSLNVFVSDNHTQALIQTQEVIFPTPVNGTGDLLSAIYIGSYLANKNIVLALQHVVYFMEKVLQNTLLSKERELQVLSEKYELSTATKLPKVMIDWAYA
jgi:pyridoxine kinase